MNKTPDPVAQSAHTAGSELRDFAARVERGLHNIYHGDLADRAVSYRVIHGAWPAGLSGRMFTTVFPYEAIHSADQVAAAPNMLTAPGRVLTVDLSPTNLTDDPTFTLRTHAVHNDSWHLRQLAPEAFVRTDFAEFSWFGLSNLSNTTPIPSFPAPKTGAPSGVRLLLSYDAGRPVEVSPVDLAFLTPVGRQRDYHAALRGVFMPMIMTTGHPLYDPDFEPGRPRLIYTNLVPRVETFFAPNQPVRADLYLLTWDGRHPGPTSPMRIYEGGKPVVLEQASAHQICLTRDHIIILGSTLVLGVASLVSPLRPMLRDALEEAFGGAVPRALDRIDEWLSGRLQASVPPAHTVVYIIDKAALRLALARRSPRIEARSFTLEWESTHAVADHACDHGRITLYAQHNVGADPADQLEPGDPLVGGGTVRRDLEGILSSSTDLNQVRKHVIDLHTGVVTTTAFPDPDGPDFARGLNLLPPLQVLPYRSAEDDVGHDLTRCVDRMDHTVWVSGGYIPCTMDQRVFDIFYRTRVADQARPQRLVPFDDYLHRIRDPSHTVRLFRLDRDLKLESEYAFPPGWFIGAPVFVPRKDATSMRHGWLVAQVWSPDHAHMEVWVWDQARSLADGPVAKLGPATPADALQPGFPLHASWIDDDGVAGWSRADYEVPTIEVPRSVKGLALLTLAGTALSRWLQQRLAP